MRFLCQLTICFLLLTIRVKAQQVSDTAGQKTNMVPLSAYRFPFFQPGLVFLRNRDTVPAYLNYHWLRNEMQFINEHGDTLKLKDEVTITKVSINDDDFYFNDGKWIQKIETTAGIILGYWTNALVELNMNKTGFVDYQLSERKVWEGDSRFIVNTKDFYFFGDAYGKFTKANRNNLLWYFEKHAPLIKQYLNQHATDFRKLSNIRDVLQFCNTLN